MNSSVTTVFAREEEIVRGASLHGTRSRVSLQRALQSAMGTVAFNNAGDRVYYTAPGASKVRHVVDVDAAFTDPVSNVGALYDAVVDPVVARAVEHQRDAVIIVAGETGSKKADIIHGGVPEFTLDVPPRAKWGVAYRAVERMLEHSQSRPLDITCTFSRVHLDHISDVLVNVATKQDKAEADKVKAYYQRLMSLNHGSTLDLEEAPEGAKVRFQALDQVEAPIRSLEDFLHVINCRGALTAASGALMKLISKKGQPFYYVLNFSFMPADESPLTATPHYVTIVETGDLDWNGPDEDMLSYRATFDSLTSYAAAVQAGNKSAAENCARGSIVGRAALGNVDCGNVDVVFVGTARYSSAFRTMKRLADCRRARPYVLLEGPDGEGADDVDPELRSHVMTVQDQCDSLRREVEALRQARDDLQYQIQRDDNTISRLQEQQTLVRRMTMTANAAAGAAGVRGDSGLGGRHSGQSHRQDGSRPGTASSSAEQRRAESQARRLAQLAALDRDLAQLKDEDQRKSEATQQQIRFLHAESRRCANNAQSLERELAQLQKALADQDARFKLEREQREQQMEDEITSIIARNKSILEARNAQRRDAVRQTQEAMLHNHEVAVRQEKLFLEELGKNATELAKRIEAENIAWEAKLDGLSRELVEVAQKRDAVQAEADAAEARFKHEMQALDMESVVLCKYLNDITNVIWRFENHSCSEIRRVVNIPMCGVKVFDLTARHTPQQLEAMCSRVRHWLTDRGVPGPLVYHDVANDRLEVIEEGLEQLLNPSAMSTKLWSPMREREQGGAAPRM